MWLKRWKESLPSPPPGRGAGGDGRPGRFRSRTELFDDLTGGEIALDAVDPAGAEDAPHAAADLRTDARGAAAFVLNQYAFDPFAVAEFHEQLVCVIAGTLMLDDPARQRHERLGQLLAQRFG